jgi:hypothetical protein
MQDLSFLKAYISGFYVLNVYWEYYLNVIKEDDPAGCYKSSTICKSAQLQKSTWPQRSLMLENQLRTQSYSLSWGLQTSLSSSDWIKSPTSRSPWLFPHTYLRDFLQTWKKIGDPVLHIEVGVQFALCMYGTFILFITIH